MTSAARAASEHEKLRLELYMAFLSSALAMGKDIQKLSWFGKNHVATMPRCSPSLERSRCTCDIQHAF